MNLDTFFEKFDQFADAPNAVAKMRELVLTLAIRGKLLPQNLSDEPADTLFRRIEATREGLIADRLIKYSTPAGNLSVADSRYSIPDNWIWTRLGSVFDVRDGTHDTPKYTDEGYPLITSNNISSGALLFETAKFISTDDHRKISERSRVDRNDILFAMIGSIGNPVIVNTDREFSIKNIALFKPFGTNDFEPRFLLFFLTQVAEEMRERAAGGVQSFVSLGFLRDYPFPLPPLAEQKRIVSKVDELMALCDQLEAQQEKRETQHAALARASLSRFADAPTPANLNFLFHKSYTIPPADIRKTILTLAVQGKLVPQDPRDESVETLNSILPSELRAVADRTGVRFSAPSRLIDFCDDLPCGWGSAPLQSIGITQTGTTPSKSEPNFTGSHIPFIKPGDISGNKIDYENEGLSADGLGVGRLIPKNSILMVSIGGSIGKTALVDRDVSCNQQINCITPAECFEPRFILTAIKSRDFQAEVMNRAAQGTLPIISKSKWETICIPLPPPAEQRRIVAKVVQLMALVDKLETQLAASRTTAENLMEAIVAELTNHD